MDLQTIELPVCRHRVETHDRSVCKSPAVHAVNGVDSMTCLTCAIRDHVPVAQRQRKMSVRSDVPKRIRESKPTQQCEYLGKELEQVNCKSCRGTVKLKVFSCEVHGKCMVGKATDGIRSCNGCPDRKVPALVDNSAYTLIATKPTTRNLLFHVYPLRDSSVWRWNIEQLLMRLDQFNGKRIIGIATSNTTVGESEVLSAFRNSRIDDVVVVNNDRGLREVATFDRLFSGVKTDDPDQITFYCHSKGIRHGMTSERGTTATDWAQVMYEACLDYPDHVDDVLQRYPCAGPFKKVGRGFAGSDSQWHYSGSFFWFRNATLFSNNWQRIDRTWFGIEPYLSLHFDAKDAGCLFMEGIVGTVNDKNRSQAMANRHLDCYDWKFMQEHIKPEWEKWKQRHCQS